VGLFRRREPLHQRLAREGGLETRPRVDPRPAWQETGIHGIQRPREWDVTVTADAPGVDGSAVTFVVLPDGTMLVEDGPDTPLELLATAVESELRPPYRARGVRQGESLWVVQARRIEVIELPEAPEAEALDLTHTAEGTELRIDGQRTFGSLPALDERGAREGPEYAVHAEALDGDLWEVRASAL
jgi:hypothetical protein